jgi:hypothetical protein
MTTARCEKCGQAFTYSPSTEKGRFCSRQCFYDHKRLTKEEKERSTRSAAMKYRYGITADDYERMLADQAGGCAICGGVNPPKSKRRLGVDHNHACCPGKRSCGRCVRKLLCDRCNNILGQANDDTERLRRCIQYLEEGSDVYDRC